MEVSKSSRFNIVLLRCMCAFDKDTHQNVWNNSTNIRSYHILFRAAIDLVGVELEVLQHQKKILEDA